MINMPGYSKQMRHTCARLVLLIQFSVWCSSAASMSNDLPCPFLDSINITNGIFQPNKSIIFDGTVFPEGQYAEINYILNEGSERESVKLHIRGCICSLRPCIRFCCSVGSYLVTIDGSIDCKFNESIESSESLVLDQDNKLKRVKLDEQFEIIDEKPCTELYFVEEKYQITYVRCN